MMVMQFIWHSLCTALSAGLHPDQFCIDSAWPGYFLDIKCDVIDSGGQLVWAWLHASGQWQNTSLHRRG